MKKIVLLVTLAALLLSAAAFAQTTTLQVAVAPQASITILTTPNTNLTQVGGAFSNYTGTTNFTYKLRTTNTTGTGAISMSMVDFNAGGPTAANLSYTCANGSTGTACSGTNAGSASSSMPVASFGAGAHENNQTGSVSWSLPDDPTWAVGSYSALVTFTISAT